VLTLAGQFDRHGKNAFVNLKQAVSVWARLLARDGNARVVKRVLEAVSAVLPLALKVVQLDEDPRALHEGLGEIEQTAMALLSQPVATPVGVQLIRFVEALVLCYLPVPPASAGVRVFDVAEVPDQHPLLRKANLMEMGESYVVFLVSYLGTAGIRAQMAAAVVTVLSNIAWTRGGKLLEHIVPALVALDANEPVAGLVSAVDRKSVKKALQLALLRVLKLGEVIVIWAANLESRIIESGGQKQLEKQRRGNKRGREDYDWDFEGPGAGGATDDPAAQQQPAATQATYHAGAAAASPAAALYVPPDLVLLEGSVLADVEELIKEMSLEQMADIVIENMAVFAAVGAKPGDEAFFELAVARDPRRTEERRARQKAPKIALAGVTADGLRVPRMDEESSYRRMWRECVVRLLNSEETVSLKGGRGMRLRATLLARLLAGKPLDEEVCRAALLHITNDFRARWGVALQWLHEEYRMEGFAQVDDEDVKAEPAMVAERDDGGLAKMDEEQEDGEVVAQQRKQLNVGKRYHYIFMYVLDGALGTVDLLQEALSALLLEAPWLPAGALAILQALGSDVEKCEVGQSLLAALAAGRPRYREAALHALLQEGLSTELRVRSSAIPQLVHLATSSPDCGLMIRDFAQCTFVEAATNHVLNVECKAENFSEHAPAAAEADDARGREMEAQQAELRRLQGEKSAASARMIQAQEVGRTCSLLFALAGFELSLLAVVAQHYHVLGPVFKQEVHGLMRVCVEHALSNAGNKEPPALVPVLEQFPPHAKDLLLLALHLVVDSGATDAPTEALARFCRARFAAEGEDARLLLPVLKVMKGREILQDVPHFMALPRHSLQEFINRALAVPYFVEKPAELLLRFHQTTSAEARCSDNDLLLRQNAAISLGFLHPRLSKDASASLLRKLAEGAAVHSMFMKTAMAAVQKFPDLLPWVQDSLLPKLVKAKAWKDPVLWKGFVKFCLGSIAQGSAAVLLQLPLETLTALLEEEPSALPHLKKYVKEHPKSAGTAIKRLLRGNK
jgi:hypothetical protein